MNRPIKFRAWDLENGKWIDPIYIRINCDGSVYQWMEASIPQYSEWGLNKNIRLVQFTGLHDKNGNEIYEGDILLDLHNKYELVVRYGLGQMDSGIYEYIGFYTDLAKDGTQTEDSWMLPQNCKNTVVIGNIFQNAELVGEE